MIIPILMLTAATHRVSDSPSVAQGRAVYANNCSSCHNENNPYKAGPVGPAIGGSSEELVEARVVRAEYPKGYKPKRDTHMMFPMPWLKDDVHALKEFLNLKEEK